MEKEYIKYDNKIMREDKLSITKEDKKILKLLMLKKVPENKRARV